VRGQSPCGCAYDDGLRCGWAVAQRAVGANSVIVFTPPFDQYLGLQQRVENLTVEQLIAELSVERLDLPPENESRNVC